MTVDARRVAMRRVLTTQTMGRWSVSGRRCRRHRPGRLLAFTLLELLVVIAIVTLLISILVPSLTKGRELARQAVCASSMRNIGVAYIAYAAENGRVAGCWGYSPSLSPDFTKAGYAYDIWAEYLDMYLGGDGSRASGCVYLISEATRRAISCPTDMTRIDRGGTARRDWGFRISYGLNNQLIPTKGDKYTIEDLGRHGSQMLMHDSGLFATYASAAALWEYLSLPDIGSYTANMWARHNLGMNVLWVDGHVAWGLKTSFWLHDMNPLARGLPGDVQFPDDAKVYNP